MADQEMKLIGSWISPFVRRVEWALKLKGIDEYEFVQEDLLNKSPLLLNYNPVLKRVPVLVHGGKPIAESLVIIEYIDEIWKHNPILPQDPYHRARARFWAKFIDEKLTEAMRSIIFTDGEEQEKAVKQATEALEVLEGEMISDQKFLGSDEVGLVEIALGTTIIWLRTNQEGAIAGKKVFDSEKYPCITKWVEQFEVLAVIKENLPPRDKLAEYFKGVRQYVLARAAQD